MGWFSLLRWLARISWSWFPYSLNYISMNVLIGSEGKYNAQWPYVQTPWILAFIWITYEVKFRLTEITVLVHYTYKSVNAVQGSNHCLFLGITWYTQDSCCFPGVTTQWVVSFTAHLRALASSFWRFLDHTQRRATVCRTPLDEWSVRRRDLYLTTHNTHNKHPCPRWDLNPRSQQASGRKPTP